MRTLFLSVAGAAAVAAFAFSANAQTQCWRTGYDYSCAAPPVSYYEPPPPYGPTPYAAWNAYDYRDYRYDPPWLPSFPGPRPSSGTFGAR
jgi:hypothetical protein